MNREEYQSNIRAAWRTTSGSGESLAVSEELGDIYFSCDAYTQAEGQYRQVLAGAGSGADPARRANLHLKIARAMQRQGRSKEVLRELEAATSALDGAADAPADLRGRIAATHALVHRQLAEYEAAARKCHEALRFLGADEDGEERAEVELCLGTVCLRQGNLFEAERWYKKSLLGMSRLGCGEGAVKALNNLGLVHRNLGRWDRAVDYFQRGIDAAEKLGQYSTIAVCSANLGLVHFHRGDWPRAIACLNRSLAIYRDVGHTLGVVTASLGLGRIHTTLHEWEEARVKLQEALRVARERNLTRETTVALEFLGDFHLERGELTQAEKVLREGLRAALSFAPRSDHVSEISRRLGELELARGNPQGAIAHLEEGLQVAREINDRREEGVILRVLGEAYAAAGERARAVGFLADAVGKLRGLGERFELGKALLASGMVAAESGSQGFGEGERGADAFLREAREIFQGLGVRYLAARANVELVRCERRPQEDPMAERQARPGGAVRALPKEGIRKRPTLRESVAELERTRILETLEEFGGNQTKVALALGLTRKGLASKMRRYGLRADDCGAAA